MNFKINNNFYSHNNTQSERTNSWDGHHECVRFPLQKTNNQYNGAITKHLNVYVRIDYTANHFFFFFFV